MVVLTVTCAAAGGAPAHAAPPATAGLAGVATPEPPAAPALTGVVRDGAGRPLGNVTVALPALQRQTTTDAEGRFAFRGLPAGTYQVTAFQVGFAVARATATVSERGADVAVALTLRPATVRLETV